MRNLKTKVISLETTDNFPECSILKSQTGEIRLPVAGGEFRRLVMTDNRGYKKQHLYFTLPVAKCSKGDMTIHHKHGLVMVTHVFDYGYNVTKPDWYKQDSEKGEFFIGLSEYVGKVVATTDYSLNMPLISKDFLHKYKILNGIEFVMVKYKDEIDEPNSSYDYILCRDIVNPTGVKNLWNKKELIKLFNKFKEDSKDSEDINVETWVEINCI